MALPKEPRQKMINMMYLVLTALLALNVSAEIINAFKTVDNSLLQSNAVLNTSSSSIYQNFDEMLKDPKTAEKAAIWKPKADQARQLAKQTSDMIDKYKLQLKGLTATSQRSLAFRCALGNDLVQAFKFTHFLKKPTAYAIKIERLD